MIFLEAAFTNKNKHENVIAIFSKSLLFIVKNWNTHMAPISTIFYLKPSYYSSKCFLNVL